MARADKVCNLLSSEGGVARYEFALSPSGDRRLSRDYNRLIGDLSFSSRASLPPKQVTAAYLTTTAVTNPCAMPTYRLHYFTLRGRAETLRYILHGAEVPFEDIRVTFEEWPALKPDTPLGQLPYLEADGLVLVQSHSIARYLARKHGLAGRSPMEEYRANASVDFMMDLKLDFYQNVHLVKDEAQKAENRKKFLEETFPSFAQRMVRLIYTANHENYSGCFAGKEITWADIEWATTADLIMTLVKETNLLARFPLLQRIKRDVETMPGIARYLETRPETPF